MCARKGMTLLLSAFAVSCGPAAPPSAPLPPSPVGADLPRRCRVHVDHVARTRLGEFESARHELLAALAAKGVSEGTTFVLETDEPTYLSLRPFEHYADLDGAGARQKEIDDAVGEATMTRLDGITHKTLVPPHRNEMWSLQSDLSYVPTGGPTLSSATVGRLVEHEVMPEQDDTYVAAVTREVQALAAAKYPVSRVVYLSAYGSGRYETLWMGTSRDELDAPLPPDASRQEVAARTAANDETRHGILFREDLSSR